MRERAARHADFRRFDSIASPVETLQLALHGGVGGLCLECAFHVPDCRVQISLLVVDEAHPRVRDEIIGNGHEYTLENICRVVIPFGFQIGFSEKAVGFEMFGKGFENVMTMGDGFLDSPFVNHCFDFPVIKS